MQFKLYIKWKCRLEHWVRSTSAGHTLPQQGINFCSSCLKFRALNFQRWLFKVKKNKKWDKKFCCNTEVMVSLILSGWHIFLIRWMSRTYTRCIICSYVRKIHHVYNYNPLVLSSCVMILAFACGDKMQFGIKILLLYI